jgi:hypothetical protein
VTASPAPLLADRRGVRVAPEIAATTPSLTWASKPGWCPVISLFVATAGVVAFLALLRSLLVPLLQKDLEEGVP